jgi:hypothetical protein
VKQLIFDVQAIEKNISWNFVGDFLIKNTVMIFGLWVFARKLFAAPKVVSRFNFIFIVPSWNYSDSSESKPGFNLNCPAEQYRYILSIYSCCSCLIVQFRAGRVLYESSNLLSAINMTPCCKQYSTWSQDSNIDDNSKHDSSTSHCK